MENEFPPNSHVKKEARPERHPEKASEKTEVARVTRSKAILRKKPLYKKFLDAFRPEDNKGFAEYMLLDMLVPGIKDAVADAGTAAIENALGSGGGRNRRRHMGGGGSGYTSYNRMGSARPRSRRDRDRDDDRRSSRHDDRGASNHQEIIIDTRVEAEETLDGLFELISKYDVATMRDLLSMVGEPHSFTDEDWGWTDLRGARVHKVRGGYLLDLPRPESLD